MRQEVEAFIGEHMEAGGTPEQTSGHVEGLSTFHRKHYNDSLFRVNAAFTHKKNGNITMFLLARLPSVHPKNRVCQRLEGYQVIS